MKNGFVWTLGFVLFFGLMLVCVGESAEQPSAIGKKVEIEFPAVGTVLVKKMVEKNKLFTTTVLEDGVFEGQQVHRMGIDNGNKILMYDFKTKNYVGLLENGEITWRARPHDGFFQSPLYVGKKYTAKFKKITKKGKSSFNGSVKVESYEKVKVPAGTFDSLKIVSTDRHVKVTLWYCPRLKWIVKSVKKHRKRGTTTIELVEYRVP